MRSGRHTSECSFLCKRGMMCLERVTKGTRSGDNTAFAPSFALNPGFVWLCFSVDGIKQGRKRLYKIASCLAVSRGERI